jgi:undecaprenyl-diphosphatase
MNSIIIFVATYVIALAVIAVPIVFFQLKSNKEKRIFLIAVVASGLLSLLLAHIAGSLFYNARPFVVGHFTPLVPHASDNGFPSDHTLLAGFIGWVLLGYSRKYGIAVLVIAALVGTARVLAGVHHSIDIIGSFVISGIAVLIVTLIMRKIKATRGESKPLAR